MSDDWTRHPSSIAVIGMKRPIVITAGVIALSGCTDATPETSSGVLQDALGEPDLVSLLEIVNSDVGEGWLSLSPDNQIALFSRQVGGFGDQRIFLTEWGPDGWSSPSRAPFAMDLNERSARFSGDGASVFFASTRPVPGFEEAKDFNIWSVSIDESGTWGTPSVLSDINSPADDFHPSVMSNGTVFFGSPREGGMGRSDQYFASPGQAGWFLKSMGTLNTEFSEPDPFIAPDGSYLIFARTGAPDGFGGDDLYVAFSSAHGWSEPKNLGDAVNTPEYEYGAFVTSDGKTLFYTTWASGTPQVAAIALSELDTGL